ncbi:MAG: hypothetical protein HY689_02400 [Chloroflexi bacterium]|nr:hypothetical protein [Chloroflexota bacterium]
MRTEPEIEFLDLREEHNPQLLESFYRALYQPAFTSPAEVETPDIWQPLLCGPDPGAPSPIFHVLLAGQGLRSPAPALYGGLLFEFYRESRCGFLTYLVVGETYRGGGLGRRLVEQGIAILHQDARRSANGEGSGVNAVFAELHDPRKVQSDAMDPWLRVTIFEKLGFRILDMPYIQPELIRGRGRSRDLMLAVLATARAATAFPSSVVLPFLQEFYRSLGVDELDTDPDFREMVQALPGDTVPFVPRGARGISARPAGGHHSPPHAQ